MKKGIVLLICFLIVLPVLSQDKKSETNAGVSYVSTVGNTNQETFSLNFRHSAQGVKNSFEFQAQLFKGYLNGKKASDRLDAMVRYEFKFAGPVFAFATLSNLQDDFAGYTARWTLGPGLGVDIINREKHQLKMLISALYFWDDYTSKYVENRQYGTVTSNLDYMWKLSETATAKFLANGYYSLEDSQQYGYQFDIIMDIAINKVFSIGFQYQRRYNHWIPGNDFKRLDSIFMTTLVMNLKSGEKDD